MKVIDFEKKGHVVRFYLGKDDLADYWGDDWNDRPYECNAETVYEEFVSDYLDIAFAFDCMVLEPQDDWRNQGNSRWCKDDMRERKVPCIIIVPPDIENDTWDDSFGYWVGNDNVKKIYFNDSVEVLHELVKYNHLGVEMRKEHD